MSTEPIEIEDLLAALKAGRKPRDHGPYKVQVGDHDLKFTDAVIDDPTPTGPPDHRGGRLPQGRGTSRVPGAAQR
ncbi:hypothetical protein E0K89_006960 [Aquicoccus sp. SCR17]|nr:hypothetical protein [Carideicomes alvinocaridis]